MTVPQTSFLLVFSNTPNIRVPSRALLIQKTSIDAGRPITIYQSCEEIVMFPYSRLTKVKVYYF